MTTDDTEFIRMNPQEYADWKRAVDNGDTLLGIEDWLNEQYQLSTVPTPIVHYGPRGKDPWLHRDKAACGVTYAHPGTGFTLNKDRVTCIRCRGTHDYWSTNNPEGARQ